MSQLKSKTNGAGYKKITNACDLAHHKGYEWVWIDTCCIDKTSSAQLSEAINSRWKWYADSSICFAHIVDVTDGNADASHDFPFFRLSEWFRRGWTLQELLAPTMLLFCDAKWEPFGDKDKLSNLIEAIAGIKSRLLPTQAGLSLEIINTKMTWAADRKTARIEDQAYSLRGLFGVNLPLLYGGGRKAFRRLQQELMINGND